MELELVDVFCSTVLMNIKVMIKYYSFLVDCIAVIALHSNHSLTNTILLFKNITF